MPLQVGKLLLRNTLDSSCGNGAAYAPIEFPVFIDQFEIYLGRTNGFRFTQEQVSAGHQREGKLVEHVVLQFRSEIDQHIATQDQVDAREWRAPCKILLAKDNHLPKCLGDTVAVISALEKAVTICC